MEKLDFGGKKLGFGFMRLPLLEGGKDMDVDLEKTFAMVDRFMEAGFRYFDTAHGYHEGASEKILKQALVDRYPRESYLIADKLTHDHFQTEADIRPLIDQELELVGVSYFDFFLMHSMTQNRYEKYKACRAYEVAAELKREGKIRHIGISFHDKPELLRRILTEQPEVEFVQIQLNYVDYEDGGVQSRANYEVCCEFGKPVIVMEPVKGGLLANLPEAAGKILDELGGGSYPSYAIRFAASHENVAVVLSGMSTLQQVEDNLSFMADFKPLDEQERVALDRVCTILKEEDLIPCTACRYCVEGCPKKIAIPDLFACMNAKKRYQDWSSDFYYEVSTEGDRGKAGDCIACRKCEGVCPQHLPITTLLRDVAAAFEKESEK